MPDSFSAEKGEIIGIIGHTGSGKSTLMKILTGLIHDYKGSVLIEGNTPGDKTKAITAYLPEQTFIHDWMRNIDAVDYFNDFFKDFDKNKALEMLKRFSFWRAFLLLAFATAVGNSVISFARDLALSVGSGVALATSLVGVLAVCNGLGRIITGAMFDAFGRKTTMLIATILTIVAAGTTLLSVFTGSVIICIVGLCLTGLSYGSCPTMVSAFVSAFYGQKHFAYGEQILYARLHPQVWLRNSCPSASDRLTAAETSDLDSKAGQ